MPRGNSYKINPFNFRTKYQKAQDAKKRSAYQGPEGVRKAVARQRPTCDDHGIKCIERGDMAICPICRSDKHP